MNPKQKKTIFPKKYLGQNFLTDSNIQNKIISSCDLNQSDTILEIGPGKGALTKLISSHVKEVIAVEKDKELCEELKDQFKNSNVKIINADILKFSFDYLPEIKIVGNLPYNISTPIIEKAIINRHKFKDFFMTVQLEFGQRMNASPNSKSYGSFSCFVNFYSNIDILFKISKNAFYPAPKVQSCFIHLSIPEKEKYTVSNEKLLFKIIKQAFSQRRKTLYNSLAALYEKVELLKIFKKISIPSNARAENLSIEDYINLVNEIGKV